jgi:hypothetical protein
MPWRGRTPGVPRRPSWSLTRLFENELRKTWANTVRDPVLKERAGVLGKEVDGTVLDLFDVDLPLADPKMALHGVPAWFE